MSTISTKVVTEPSGAYDLSSNLSSQQTSVSSASSLISTASMLVPDAATGATGSSISATLSSKKSATTSLANDISTLSEALNSFAETMSSVKSRLLQARGDATAANLKVSGDTIHAPEESDPDYEDKQKTFDDIAETVEGIRDEELEAHETLQSSCSGLRNNNFTSEEFLTGAGNVYNTAVSWAGYAQSAAEITREVAKRRISTFIPRYPSWHPKSGAYVKKEEKSGWGRLKTMWEKGKSRNWTPKPYTKTTTTAGRVMERTKTILNKIDKPMKYAGRASTVVTSALTAWDQYKSDSTKHPGMGEGEKLARAGVKAGAEAGTAWAGAAVGTKAGVAIGGVIGGPVGAAVGGVVGGVAGGIAGSELGQAAGDKFAEGVSKLKDGLGKLF